MFIQFWINILVIVIILIRDCQTRLYFIESTFLYIAMSTITMKLFLSDYIFSLNRLLWRRNVYNVYSTFISPRLHRYMYYFSYLDTVAIVFIAVSTILIQYQINTGIRRYCLSFVDIVDVAIFLHVLNNVFTPKAVFCCILKLLQEFIYWKFPLKLT